MSSSARWFCEECNEVCADEEVLAAPHPFDAGEIICGCPHCRAANTLVSACDLPCCKQRSSSGTPTPEGYVWRCLDHSPRREDAA